MLREYEIIEAIHPTKNPLKKRSFPPLKLEHRVDTMTPQSIEASEEILREFENLGYVLTRRREIRDEK